MSGGLIYHAVLVDNNGVVQYIHHCGTLETEQDMVNYWKRGRFEAIWGNSFVAKQPLNFDEGDTIKRNGNKITVIKKEE